jgi:hypothetical protein
MNAIGTPAPAGTAGDGRLAPDRRDWLRLVGGMMFGAGALVLLIRKSSDWSDWAQFAGLLIPALVLLAIAFVSRARWGMQGSAPAYLVFGTLLLLGSLLQLVNAANGNPRASLNIAWTFAVAGAVAFVTALVLRARVQMLVGALLWLVAWLALWNKILTNPSGDTVRWLLLAIAAIYVFAAALIARTRRAEGSDLVTIAGVAAVLAGALSIAGAASSQFGALSSNTPKPSQGWNVFLLVVSLLLIGYASRSVTRGPGYVGAAGLLGFIGVTGADLVTRLNGDPGGGVVGWPLILLIGGGAAILLSFVLAPGALGGPGGTPAPLGGPGAGAPPQAGAPPRQSAGLLDQWRQQPPPGPGAPPPPPQQ